MTAYQKLKKENAKLKQDLYFLVNYPESATALKVKFEWLLKKKMEEQFMAGSPTTNQ